MRALNLLLVVTLGWGPAFQAYAGTLSETHCRTHGHISLTAVDAAHDATHAAHHGDQGMNHDGASASSADGAQCKCGCLCNLACAASPAPVASFAWSDASEPEHFRHVSTAAPPHAEHSAPQRPPAVFS